MQFTLCERLTSTSLPLLLPSVNSISFAHPLSSLFPPPVSPPSLPSSNSPFSCFFSPASPHYNHLVSSPLDVMINIRRKGRKPRLCGVLYMLPINRQPPGKFSLICFFPLIFLLTETEISSKRHKHIIHVEIIHRACFIQMTPLIMLTNSLKSSKDGSINRIKSSQ